MGKLVAGDLLQPLNHELVPALEANNWGVFQDPYYDLGWRYSVPYTIYTTGVGYRRDHIPDDVIHGMDNPWDDPVRSPVRGEGQRLRPATAT